MIRNIILRHKEEREKFYLKTYIEREKLSFYRNFLSSDLIKIITGPRRAGKSVFAFLLLTDTQFGYLNFDDENLLKINDYDELLEGLISVYGNVTYLFFDEIQNLPSWEIFVNKLHRRGYNIILTGSNSKLLSSELASYLTGRHIAFEILPFSFREFLKAEHITYDINLLTPELKGLILNKLSIYLHQGGYPQVIMDKLDYSSYLKILFESILFIDVVKRYRLKHSSLINNFSLYLISEFTSEYTYTSLKDNLEFKSVNTVMKYLDHLEEAYLFFSLKRYSHKYKEQIKTSKKIYLIDNGYISAKAFQVSPNYGRLMENTVFIELIRKGYKPGQEIFYYKSKNKKEIDFVLKKGLTIDYLIQVCYDISNYKTRKRELNALIESSQELNCNNLLVITYDFEAEEVHSEKKIVFIPLWKWLLT
ncbi:MAG: ATP-binding protein [Candidatus Eremiobacterota bacterium]